MFLLFLFIILLSVTNNFSLVFNDLFALFIDTLYNVLDLLSVSYVLLIYLIFPFLYNPTNIITLKSNSQNLINEEFSINNNSNLSDYSLISSMYKTSSKVNTPLYNYPLFNNYTNISKPTSNINLVYTPDLTSANTSFTSVNTNISLDQMNKLLRNKYFIFTSSNFSKDLDLMKTDR